MRKILLAAYILLPTIVAYSQVQQVWAVSHIATMRTFFVDPSGNSYAAGAGSGQSLIFKHNKSGTTLWIATVGIVQITAMTVDGTGNVYVTGMTGFTPSHYVTAKYNTNGAFQWTNVYFEDDVHGIPTSIAVDPNGDVYVTGVSYTAFTEGDIPLLDESSADYATVKYRGTDGDETWVRRYNGASPGAGFDFGAAIITDAFGYVYVTGTSQLNGQLDIATVKYTPTGDILWVQRYDDPGFDDYAADMKLDLAGNVIIAGSKVASNGQADMKVIKYTFSGFLLWAKNGFNLMNGERRSTNVVTDNTGNVFVLGEGHHAIVTKFNAAGDQLWLNQALDLGGRQADLATDGVNAYIAGGNTSGLTTVKLNSAGAEQWRVSIPTTFTDITVQKIGVDANMNVFSSNTTGCLVVRYSQCQITCPGNITVNNDPGECGAVVTFSDATTSGDCGATISYSHTSGDFFDIGTTTVTVTSDETGATCSFTVTVNDNVNPVFSNCPSDKTVNTDAGVCYASASSVNAGTATATDNCGATVEGVRSDGLSLTDNYSVGTTTITWTATDPSNNTTTCTQNITVIDNIPPTISGESASTYVLSTPNHTMRDVTINYTATDNCAVTTTVVVTSNESINGVADGDTDPDYIVLDNISGSGGQYVSHLQLRAERSAQGDGRIYTVTITAVDPSNNITTSTIEIKVPHDIKNPHSGQPFKVGSSVSLTGEFWDIPVNKHSAKWLIDENTAVKGSVTEPTANRNGKVTASYKFNSPGVYKLQMNITDQNGLTTYTNTAGDLEAIVVIYDPNGGYTYGGGYFSSPAGALISKPSATGKASYGFTANYFKSSTYPKGEAQFEFKVGDFEFNALNFDYLVINNAMAQFKGTGKISGGQSGIGFIMTIVDGQLDGTGKDKIRMKIYNKNTGEVIYDNQPGASDASLPTQAVGTNSEIVINGGGSKGAAAMSSEQTREAELMSIEELELRVYPNPANTYFNISVNSKNDKEKIVLQVYDQLGRLVEIKNNIISGSVTRFGDFYNQGVYFIRVAQGKMHKEIKLVKLID